MDVFNEMLIHWLSEGKMKIALSREIEDLLHSECYRALREIRRILADDSLEDRACFQKIEAIVEVCESIGLDCGSRHDF